MSSFTSNWNLFHLHAASFLPFRFPHGTEVTFNCIANTMGEKTTWRIHCENGAWIGQRSPSPCPAVKEEKEHVTHLKKEQEEDLELGNTSCMWRKSQPNMVTFLEDRELLEEALQLPPGTELVKFISSKATAAWFWSPSLTSKDIETMK